MDRGAAGRVSIAEVLSPRSVAVIGASEAFDKFGGRVLAYLVRHGYAGAVYPINPHRDRLLGLQAYPSVVAVGQPIDVAILAVPVDSLAASIRDCAEGGVGCAVIITAQLAEAGPEGEARQREILAIAGAAGMRILGPNCLGLVNPHQRLALTASFAFDSDTLPAGPVAIVSQSGALMATMFARAADAGIAASVMVSFGNQADLDVADFLDHLAGDPTTRAVGLYLEGLAAPERFLASADRLRAAGKPLVVAKAGRTETSTRVARSHTASLAGSYPVFVAAARAHGVIAVDDPVAAVFAADALQRWPNSGGRASGIALFSGSGGAAAMAGDQIVEAGLTLARPSAETQAALRTYLSSATIESPYDLGAFRRGFVAADFTAAMRLVAEDPATGILVYVMSTQPVMAEIADCLIDISRTMAKPVLPVFITGTIADPIRRQLAEGGLPYYDSLDDAIRVLRALDAAAGMAALAAPPARPCPCPANFASLSPGLLTEPEVKALLTEYGVPAGRERLARDASEAAAAAEAIGYPVAMKAVVRGLIHKSDIGAVKLGLTDAQAVHQAWSDIGRAVDRALPQALLDGCLVAEMIKGEVELIVGARADPQFGPVVLVGFGGLFVEVLGDVALALAPIGPAEAVALLRRLRLWPLLEGVRGRPPADVAAVAEIVSRVSWLAHDLGPRLVELDINPLLVGAAGKGARAADARATIT